MKKLWVFLFLLLPCVAFGQGYVQEQYPLGVPNTANGPVITDSNGYSKVPMEVGAPCPSGSGAGTSCVMGAPIVPQMWNAGLEPAIASMLGDWDFTGSATCPIATEGFVNNAVGWSQTALATQSNPFVTALAGWTDSGSAWSLSSGTAAHAATAADTLTSSVALVSGQSYQLVYTVTQTSGTGVTVSAGGVTDTQRAVTGTYTMNFAATATTAIVLTPTANWAGTVSLLSITPQGPVMTVASTPSCSATGGITLSGGAAQYLYTPSISTFDLSKPFTLVLVGNINNATANDAIAFIGPTTNNNEVKLQAGGTGLVQIVTYDNSTARTSTGYTCPTTGSNVFFLTTGTGASGATNYVTYAQANSLCASCTPAQQAPTYTGTTTSALYLGANNLQGLAGYTHSLTLLRAILFNRALSTSEQIALNSYLQTWAASKGVALPAYLSAPPLVTVPSNGLASTPPMGWYSWTLYSTAPTETGIKAQAAAMVSKGFKTAGYTLLAVDDGVFTLNRDSSYKMIPNPTNFPDGMSGGSDVVSYAHNNGLLYGGYLGAGRITCSATSVGSFGYEALDIQTIAGWKWDYLKMDQCENHQSMMGSSGTPGAYFYMYQNFDPNYGIYPEKYAYNLFGMLLLTSGRPIIYNVSTANVGNSNTWYWKAGGNMSRIAPDQAGTWSSILQNLYAASAWAGVQPVGYYNDLDALYAGNGTLNDNEGEAQMSLYSLFDAPLIMSIDLTAALSTATTATYLNKDIIAVDQDSLNDHGTLVATTKVANGNQKTVTISLTNPAVISASSHGFTVNEPVIFTNSGGSLPAHIVSGTTYYVIPVGFGANSFEISASICTDTTACSAISTLGDTQSGTQTATAPVNTDVIVKKLSGGAWAIGFLNEDSSPHNISTTWSAINGVIPSFPTTGFTQTKDLWANWPSSCTGNSCAGGTLGTLSSGYTSTSVAAHFMDVIRVAP